MYCWHVTVIGLMLESILLIQILFVCARHLGGAILRVLHQEELDELGLMATFLIIL